jgi:hypothetical protein
LSNYGYVQVMDGIRSWIARHDNAHQYVELLKELHEADLNACFPWEMHDERPDIDALAEAVAGLEPLRERIEKMENDLKTALWALGKPCCERVYPHEHLEDGAVRLQPEDEDRVTGAGAPKGGWQARGFHDDGKFCARALCGQMHVLKGELINE